VLVSPERVIRHVAGLRPFRRSGFSVRTESIGDKPIIHNYGHGGGGVSLSWGCAHLAAEQALAMPHRDVGVIGCGVIGLTTARLLQDRGFTVTIYARELPPDTTSNISGALWAPVTVVDSDRRTAAFDEQFVRASRFAFRYFQNLAGGKYGVWWRERYTLSDTRQDIAPAGGLMSLLADLRPLSLTLAPGEHPFGSLYAVRSLTMHIEPSIFLPAVLMDFRAIGGKVVVREFRDVGALRELPHPLLVNCTGLGSATLFADSDMLPIKGQLTVLAPQPEVDYLTVGPGELYMMPRQDGIILGGTNERGEWSLEPNPVEIDRIVRGHRALFAQMNSED
jgi:D-amino-acid oxidase